ncbi:Spore cortex-lytic enzyme precursor [Pseudovibrio sp. W64]|uniref:cell wall hydrolase n=1 Tax=Pseudovibrio sp. W64 TaxID=1735583 RepID=UPI0007AE5DD1|nr:cell wall hydrolase [Pseudovibrio sp. W64]KZK78180.1 Spore cortex-lytic enzyme precursor [Pseudovibrio sp. W64]
MGKAAALVTLAGAGGMMALYLAQARGYAVVTSPGSSPSSPVPNNPNRETPSTDLNFDWLGGVTGWFSDTFGGREMKNNKPASPSGSATGVINVSRAVLVLARTLYGEARGSPWEGKQAVANVVMNRVKSRRFPNTIERVCLQSYQFSCWNEGDPNRAKIKDLQPGANTLFDQCIDIARSAEQGLLTDVTGGADHYYASYFAQPYWITNSPNARMTAQIGKHKFYTGIA